MNSMTKCRSLLSIVVVDPLFVYRILVSIFQTVHARRQDQHKLAYKRSIRPRDA